MVTLTHAEIETNSYPGGNNGSTIYVRLPPTARDWLELKAHGERKPLKIGLATGKHGKFLWIVNPESTRSQEEHL